MIHAFQLLFIDCNYPRAFVWWIGMHAVMFFFLFREFYQQAYNRRNKAAVRNTAKVSLTNGKTNGYVYQNGDSNHQKHAQPNGFHRQSSENGLTNRKHMSASASDYYMNGHIPAEIEHTIKSQ